MPIIKSAKKKLRQDIKRRSRNRIKKDRLNKAIKTFKTKPTQENFFSLQSIIDKIVKSGLIKKNKAARLKSRFAKMVVGKEKTIKRTKTKQKKKTTS